MPKLMIITLLYHYQKLLTVEWLFLQAFNDENSGSGDVDAGFTLAFTDGSKLDLIAFGNASGSHAVSVPGSAGAEGVATTSTNVEKLV